MLKVSEVYEKKFRTTKERHDGGQYVVYDTKLTSRECLINKNYIVAVHPKEIDHDSLRKNVEQYFPEGTKFSTLTLDGNSFQRAQMTVIGSFEKFCELLGT